MSEFAIIATIIKIGFAVFSVAALIFVLSHFDQRVGKTFGDSMEIIAKNPLALAMYYGLRILAVAVMIGMLIGCTAAQAGTIFPDKYDQQIKSAVKAYWPDYPAPAAWKAQLYQESRLNPDDVSPVGAAGLAQFMPATWAEVTRELRLGAVSPHADIAIQAGAYYQAKMRNQWKDRTALDANQLGQASYNAGTGHIVKAQALCNGRRLWSEIAPCLTAITGPANAKQTRDYVSRIAAYQAQMGLGL